MRGLARQRRCHARAIPDAHWRQTRPRARETREKRDAHRAIAAPSCIWERARLEDGRIQPARSAGWGTDAAWLSTGSSRITARSVGKLSGHPRAPIRPTGFAGSAALPRAEVKLARALSLFRNVPPAFGGRHVRRGSARRGRESRRHRARGFYDAYNVGMSISSHLCLVRVSLEPDEGTEVMATAMLG